MNLRSLPFWFASLLAPCLSAQTVEIAFKVGTWNLEFLGAEGNFRNNLPPRVDTDFAAIGRKVAELGVCVLAVQEICGEAPLQKVAKGAGPSWQVLLGTTGGWDDGKTAQNIGFLYDRNTVELLHAEELLELPREHEGQPIFHRVPVTACFRHQPSGCDFRLVTVHLKAGQKAQDELKRRGEATALAAWLDGLNKGSEDADVVLLGDFNSTYGKDPETLFEQSKQRRYLDHKTPVPTIMHFPEPIDHVVAGTGFRELRADSLAVDGDFDGMERDAWRRIYSDHFPVTATIVAHSDDDPQATFRRGPNTNHLPRPRDGEVRIPVPGTTKPPVVVGGEPWPPKVGSKLRVLTQDGPREGTLAFPMPEGNTGWLVLQTDQGVVGIAVPRVWTIYVL